MDIKERIEQIFIEDNSNLEKKIVEKELTAMRNAQPPTYPTFMVGQEEIKDTLKQQLMRSFENKAFFHTVIAGEVGGGKTHLLNLIKSRFNDDCCYIVQFRAEETDQTQYSFPKMIVATLFKRYYDDFKQIFLNIDIDQLKENYDNYEMANALASFLEISVNLAQAIYEYVSNGENKSSAIRIIGGCENIRDLQKLKINKLTDDDYMNIIKLFLKFNGRIQCLLVMLDEFEHSYTLFTPAKRRDFLRGYKAFLDSFSKDSSWSLLLITAATVQYKGQLQDSLIKIDTALASRLEPQTLMLDQFAIGSDEDFKKLFDEISWRYKYVYDYDIGASGAIKMRKKIFEKRDVTSGKQITYREAITTMILIMEEMDRKGESFFDNEGVFESRIDEIEISSETFEKKKMDDTDYLSLSREFENKWDKVKSRNTMIKKGIEKLLDTYIGDFTNKKVGTGKGGSSAICYIDSEKKSYIYIALQDIKEKLIACNKIKESLPKDEGIDSTTYFLYLPVEDIQEQLKNYPDIVPLNIDAMRLDLVILGNRNDLPIEMTNKILEKLEPLSFKLTGKGLDKDA